MLLCYLLFFLGFHQAAIFRSKDMQMDISYRLPLKDLLKAEMIGKNWISVERAFKRITPKAGLFENKQTNEIIFETKENSWHQKKIIEKLKEWHPLFPNKFLQRHVVPSRSPTSNGPTLFQSLIEEKNWDELFYELIYASKFTRNSWEGAEEFLKALAEIVDVNVGQIGRFQASAIHATAAVWPWDNELLEILLKRPETNLNFIEEFLRDDFGQTALCNVADKYTDDADTIETLLNYGAEVDAADDRLITPLMHACKCGNENIVKILLDHDGNPNLRDEIGQTALHYAADPSRNRDTIMKILLNHGAKVDASDKWLKTQIKKLKARERKRKRTRIEVLSIF